MNSISRHSIAIALLLLCLLPGVAGAVDNDAGSTFMVKYRSIDRVYVDAGKEQGLYPGTLLGLYSGDSLIAKLEVVYASGNSASCRVLLGDNHLDQGVTLQVLEWGTNPELQEDTQAPEVADTSRSAASTGVTTRRRDRSLGRVTGSVALQWYNWQDESSANLDFSQTTMRLNLRARHINGGDWSLNLRSRGQYDQRSRQYSTGAPSDEFVNRIYEASATYGPEDSRWEIQMGRLLPGRLTRVGYIDGVALDMLAAPGWHAGLLAGAKPRWQYQEQATSIQKFGSYLGYEYEEDNGLRLEQYIALAGEYHSGTISRELLHLYGNLRRGGDWSVYHQIDLDINRGWRMEKAGSRLALSSVYLNARYRVSRRASLGVSYDSRQNYWTYEQQTMTDSLFDDELRRGLRTRFNLRLPAHIVLNTELGYRKGTGDLSGTKSYSIYVSKSYFFVRGLNLSVRYSAFDGPNNLGDTYTFRLNHQVSNAVMLGLAYGSYGYEMNSPSQKRRNNWWESELRIELPLRTFMYGRYQHQSGDDLKGQTLHLELGKRF